MKKPGFNLAVSSAAGDPCLASTWSGTTWNLIKSLEELGATVLPIDASLRRPMRLFCRLTQRLMGFTGYPDWGPVARLIAARRTERLCLQARVKHILHTGTHDLPGTKRGDGLERFVFCDYTWDLWSRYAREAQRFSPRSSQICDSRERRAFRQARLLFPISEYVKENLTAHYGINKEIISAVGTGRGKIAPYFGAKDYSTGPILFVAKERFVEKGGALLLDGFRIAAKKNPHINLVLAGKAVDTAAAAGIPNVTLAGHVPWEELQRLFETAALFAMPAYCEPWGLVYLEALACRAPLLGLERNSLPELTQDGRFGFLVKSPDPESIADGILRATADPKKLELMGSEGQQYCLKKFLWSQTAGVIVDRIKSGRTTRDL